MGVEYGALNRYSSYGQPSLDLVFTGPKKSLRNRLGNQQVEFTRDSIGTYTDENGIIRTAAANEARFDHDSDGNILGLLIEESRVNSVSRSSDFQTDWTNTNVLVVPNSSTAPDGTLTATSIVDDTTNGEHKVSRSAYVTVPKARCTLTVFAKPNGLTTFELGTISSSNLARFTLVGEGTATPVSGSTTPAGGGEVFIEKLANGWYRCGFQANYVATITYPYIRLYNSGTSYVGNGSGVYVWGLQMENSALFPTSYIPTSGSTVTRSADVASMTGTNFSSWYNQSEGTVFVDLPTNLTSVGNNDAMFSFHNGSTNRVLPQWVTYSWFWKAAGTQIAINPYVSSTSTAGKYAFSFDSNDIAATYNGQTTNTATSSSLVQDVTGLRFFTEWNGGRAVYGHISRLTYYPTRLPDDTLQALTA